MFFILFLPIIWVKMSKGCTFFASFRFPDYKESFRLLSEEEETKKRRNVKSKVQKNAHFD